MTHQKLWMPIIAITLAFATVGVAGSMVYHVATGHRTRPHRDARRAVAPPSVRADMSEQESLLLMYGWIALAVLNLILIAVAFLQYAE